MEFSALSAIVSGSILLGLMTLALIGFAAARLYTRASEERAFVRTGLGGRKVVMSGGAIVLPIFHELVWVNRNTLRLEVSRANQQSLITQDRLRVDATAEFYVRVAPTAEAITIAAQTLGDRTNSPQELKALVEGKFVDALRSAAAQMTMQHLHEQRADFVQNVKQAVSEDLAKNGLELESVSLTNLDQTKKEYFDPNNAFDAEGLLKLTKEIETRNKARNDITQDTRIQIAEKNLMATEQQLELDRKQTEASLNQEREIENMRAEQAAVIAATQAEGRRKAQEAELAAKQEIEQKRISVEQNVAQAEAGKRKAVETAELEARTAVKLREQEQNVVLARQSEIEAAARAEADRARALAVAAEEQIATVRAVEVANRDKQVALVRAEEKAREDSMTVLISAEAESKAADDRANALIRAAQAERDAAVLRAEAIREEGAAEAEALTARNNAQNVLSAELIGQQLKIALINALPQIIASTVEPLKNIDSIRIAEVSGLNGLSSGNGKAGEAGSAGNAGGLSGEIVNAALRHRVGKDLVDGLMKDVGLAGIGNVEQMLSSVGELASSTPSVTSFEETETNTSA